MTSNQFERLKIAGYPVDITETKVADNITHTHIGYPSEKEMMEFILSKDYQVTLRKDVLAFWEYKNDNAEPLLINYSKTIDLTECLVLAVIAVMKAEK